MKSEEDRDGLSIICQGSESTPDKSVDYLSFSVQIRNADFGGQTEFEATGNQVASFLRELASLYELCEGSAELQCGWGEEVYFRLCLSRYDVCGNILMQCIMRNASVGELLNHLESFQLIEMQQVQYTQHFFEAVRSCEEQQTLLVPPKR